MIMQKSNSRILIVDDIQENIKLLGSLLTSEEYHINVARNGEEALRSVKKAKPDLILLDIMMPVMDGFETCKALKNDPEFCDIPVIFLTAINEVENIVQGFELGAADYLTKPVNHSELKARVKTHLELKKSKEIIKKQYDDLKDLESMRASLTDMVIHDLKNPLASIAGYAELLSLKSDSKNSPKYINRIINISNVLFNLIMTILDISKMESNKLELNKSKIIVKEKLIDIELGLYSLYENKNIKFEYDSSDDNLEVMVDPEIFERIVINILSNAIKYSPRDSTITIKIENCSENTTISISDEGKGVPDEFKDVVFEKFGQIEGYKAGKKYSTGLGLTFCKMAVESHGGEIGVYNNEDKGSTFWFSILNQEISV